MNIRKLKEFEEKGLVNKNINNLEVYTLIKEVILEDIEVSFKSDNSYRIMSDRYNIDGVMVKNKLTGKGVKNNRELILTSMVYFRKKYEYIINSCFSEYEGLFKKLIEEKQIKINSFEKLKVYSLKRDFNLVGNNYVPIGDNFCYIYEEPVGGYCNRMVGNVYYPGNYHLYKIYDEYIIRLLTIESSIKEKGIIKRALLDMEGLNEVFDFLNKELTIYVIKDYDIITKKEPNYNIQINDYKKYFYNKEEAQDFLIEDLKKRLSSNKDTIQYMNERIIEIQKETEYLNEKLIKINN